jgi:hypothetical protein
MDELQACCLEMAGKAVVFGNATLTSNKKFIQVTVFTSSPSQLGDSIERGAISAAAWMFVEVTFRSCNWYLGNLHAAIGQCSVH